MLTIKKQGNIAFTFALALVLLTACSPSGPRALEKGQKLMASGKASEAIVKFDQATQLFAGESPQAQAQAFNWLGVAYHQAGFPDKAAVAYREALKLDRNLAAAAYNLGCLEFERGNNREAAESLNLCLALARPPEIKESEVYSKLGSVYLNLAGTVASSTDRNRCYDWARRCFEAALKLEISPDAYNGLGIVALNRGHSPSEAVAKFKEALRIQSSFAPAWLNLAVVHHFYLNNRREALHEYGTYLQLVPTASNASEITAFMADLEREFPSKHTSVTPVTKPVTAATSSTVIEIKPTDIGKNGVSTNRYRYMTTFAPTPGNRQSASQLLTTGNQALKANKTGEALEAFQKAVQADPAFSEAYSYLGAAFLESGNLPAALEAFDKALRLKPDSTETRYAFAYVMQKSGYIQDAANELEKLVKLKPSDVRAHLFLGNLYSQDLKQKKAARQHYSIVLQLEPNHPQASVIRHWMSANP